MYDYTEGKRISVRGIDGRQYYFYISETEIVATLPKVMGEDPKNVNHYCVVTALTRMTSKLLQLGCDISPNKKWSIVKKQLSSSSLSTKDFPALMLKAIDKWEKAGGK